MNLPDEEAWFCRKTSEIVGINPCFIFLYELPRMAFSRSGVLWRSNDRLLDSEMLGGTS